MAISSIPLAKGLDLSKMEWPALLSIKHDGVPIKITVSVIHDSYSVKAVSRDNKILGGCAMDVAAFCFNFAGLNPPSGEHTFVFEVTDEVLVHFKDISGKVKRKVPQTGLVYNLFDYVWSGEPDLEFGERIVSGSDYVSRLQSERFNIILQYKASNVATAKSMIEYRQSTLPDEEGFMIVAYNRTWKPNKRHWDTQKIVVDPEHDLWVLDFEEATSKEGEPLGMVGRIVVGYNGGESGVGPGKLTHQERKDLWNIYVAKSARQMGDVAWPRRANLIATIKAKRDPSYEGLRQGTFQHWRTDKTEPSEAT